MSLKSYKPRYTCSARDEATRPAKVRAANAAPSQVMPPDPMSILRGVIWIVVVRSMRRRHCVDTRCPTRPQRQHGDRGHRSGAEPMPRQRQGRTTSGSGRTSSRSSHTTPRRSRTSSRSRRRTGCRSNCGRPRCDGPKSRADLSRRVLCSRSEVAQGGRLPVDRQVKEFDFRTFLIRVACRLSPLRNECWLSRCVPLPSPYSVHSVGFALWSAA